MLPYKMHIDNWRNLANDRLTLNVPRQAAYWQTEAPDERQPSLEVIGAWQVLYRSMETHNEKHTHLEKNAHKQTA